MPDRSAQARTPEAAFARRVRNHPADPFVTFYDDATGERTELSARSLANWVAKTYYLLTDELGLSARDRALVALPVHWLAAPIALGCWFAGLEIVNGDRVADVAFGDVHSLGALDLSAIDDGYAVSLLSMGRSAEPPAGLSDFAAAVRPQSDAWASVLPVADESVPACNGEDRGALMTAAAEFVRSVGLKPPGRLLWSRPWDTATMCLVLASALAVDGSLVLVRHPDSAQLGRKAEVERAMIID